MKTKKIKNKMIRQAKAGRKVSKMGSRLGLDSGKNLGGNFPEQNPCGNNHNCHTALDDTHTNVPVLNPYGKNHNLHTAPQGNNNNYYLANNNRNNNKNNAGRARVWEGMFIFTLTFLLFLIFLSIPHLLGLVTASDSGNSTTQDELNSLISQLSGTNYSWLVNPIQNGGIN